MLSLWMCSDLQFGNSKGIEHLISFVLVLLLACFHFELECSSMSRVYKVF